jgi:putative tricarboxylic transport membrane protein
LTAPKPTNPDHSSALICLGFAVAIGIEAYRLGPGKLGSPGPGLTPLFYASVLAFLSVILFLRSRGRSDSPTIVLRWRSILSILAILLVYGLTIEWLGYLVCTFFVMVLLLRRGGVPWIGSLLFAGAATVMVNLLFVRWLAVPLPIGSIFP